MVEKMDLLLFGKSNYLASQEVNLKQFLKTKNQGFWKKSSACPPPYSCNTISILPNKNLVAVDLKGREPTLLI